jgi:hypothetical protein
VTGVIRRLAFVPRIYSARAARWIATDNAGHGLRRYAPRRRDALAARGAVCQRATVRWQDLRHAWRRTTKS